MIGLVQRRRRRAQLLTWPAPERPRSDRSFGFFPYGLSDEGGFDDVEESLPSRRRSSPI